MGLSAVRFQDKRIWCVDGMRIAVNEDEHLTVARPFALPIPTLLRLKECGQSDMELTVGKKYVSLTGSGILLYCRLVETADSLVLDQVIPNDLPKSYQINRAQYLNEIKYLRECVDSDCKAPVLFNDGQLILFYKGSAFRAAVDVIGGPSDQHALNPCGVLEALGQFAGSEYVTLRSGGRYSPVVMTAGADTALIMPVRTVYWDKLGVAA